MDRKPSSRCLESRALNEGAGTSMRREQFEHVTVVHGAGLMLIPILLAQPLIPGHHAMIGHMIGGAGNSPSVGIVLLLAALVHTVAMLVVAGGLALAFFEAYEKAGLTLLRHAWLNFDLLWALALLIAAFAVLLF